MVVKIRNWVSPVFWARWGRLSTFISQAVKPLGPPIIVVSIPRSGSSWVGEILGSSSSSLYLREPMTQSYMQIGNKFGVFYVQPDSPPVEYARYAEQAFSALPTFGRNIVRQPKQWLLAKRRFSRLVIKEVNPMALPWIAASFKPKIIFLVRHPAAVAASHFKLGWHNVSLENRMPADLWSRKSQYSVNADFWTQHGHFQAETLQIALEALANYPDHRLVTYEDLCANPIGLFQDLYDWAGLPWTESVVRKIHEKSSSAKSKPKDIENAFETNRRSSEMISSWHRELSEEQIDHVRDSYLAHNVMLYPPQDWS